jgi:hypothetical protein
MTTQLKTEITGFLKVSAPETLIVAAGNLAILTIYLIGSELNSRPAVLCSRVNFPFVLGTTTHSRAGNCRTTHQTDVMLTYVSRIDTDMKLVLIIFFFCEQTFASRQHKKHSYNCPSFVRRDLQRSG